MTNQELEDALHAETEAKHEAVEVLREVLMGKPSQQVIERGLGIVDKHEVEG